MRIFSTGFFANCCGLVVNPPMPATAARCPNNNNTKKKNESTNSYWIYRCIIESHAFAHAEQKEGLSVTWYITYKMTVIL
jgi:hypothetical protein